MTTTRITLGDVGRIGVRCFLAEPGEPELIEALSSVYGRLVIGGSGCELCGRTSTFREFPKRRNKSAVASPPLTSLSAYNFDRCTFHVFAIAKT